MWLKINWLWWEAQEVATLLKALQECLRKRTNLVWWSLLYHSKLWHVATTCRTTSKKWITSHPHRHMMEFHLLNGSQPILTSNLKKKTQFCSHKSPKLKFWKTSLQWSLLAQNTIHSTNLKFYSPIDWNLSIDFKNLLCTQALTTGSGAVSKLTLQLSSMRTWRQSPKHIFLEDSLEIQMG